MRNLKIIFKDEKSTKESTESDTWEVVTNVPIKYKIRKKETIR